ncbi:hypothetical protein [Pasteuria penetrans]|nr:hypothetical protein [Pasteuria penetrans]
MDSNRIGDVAHISYSAGQIVPTRVFHVFVGILVCVFLFFDGI